MRFKRLWAMFTARNLEFFRDRAAFGWNFLFPFLIIAGFGIVFGGKSFSEYKAGVFPVESPISIYHKVAIPEGFQSSRYVEFVGVPSLEAGLSLLKHHKIDLLIQQGTAPYAYWTNESSPKGYILEKMLIASLQPKDIGDLLSRQVVQGKEIRYIDWLFPGILGMNMMFSALWGVGYVVVRYRKNGVLKRLQATPLTAVEYLSAQMLSRIFLLMFTLIAVWIGCDAIFSFEVAGSYLDLAVVFFLGCLSLTSMGLVLASRGTSEEFTSGVLNFISWPMMFLSEVWFSIEGAPQWIKWIAGTFPLTHLLTAARKIMNDGAGLSDVVPELMILSAMTVVCLVIGASLFSWHE
ncbi:MAG: ABC transporter permease [Deltaproteobacteria bacterium]|nr:ABC transporter permease [Deltaproteobacteria bacterium]